MRHMLRYNRSVFQTQFTIELILKGSYGFALWQPFSFEERAVPECIGYIVNLDRIIFLSIV